MNYEWTREFRPTPAHNRTERQTAGLRELKMTGTLPLLASWTLQMEFNAAE